MRHFLQSTAAALLLAASCTGCAAANAEDQKLPAGGQTFQQLHLQQDQQKRLIGTWIPYFICDRLFESGDAQTCSEQVQSYVQELQLYGVNTIFLHACAFGESIYPSAYYPQSPTVHGLDALNVFQTACDAADIELHVWINPLRLQTEEYIEEQSGSALLVSWFQDAALRQTNLSKWDGRYYLNPAAESTRRFLSDAVTELITQYHPAGIHIDDYFYPTTETAFDSNDFAASGSRNLGNWRRENITNLLKSMNSAVHAADSGAVFSVSPQGNLLQNYERLYADVAKWCLDGDCCDLLIPQIYFGYRNELCPFAETVEEWRLLPRAGSVGMAIGLAAYKVGAEDLYAGDGSREWITEAGLLARQTAEILREPELCGAVWYHSDALAALSAQERDALIRTVCEQ